MELQEKFIRDLLILWTTIDPIGTLALFALLTSDMTSSERRKTALKVVLYSSSILVGAIVVGQVLLSAMGVDLVSLQVAGAVILFLFALQMIFGSPSSGESSKKLDEGHDIAVFPLTVPSTASPGAIMAVIVLTDNNLYPVAIQAGTALITLAVLIACYFLMLLSDRIIAAIGKNGISILTRVMGLILAALSVQILFQALQTQGLLLLK